MKILMDGAVVENIPHFYPNENEMRNIGELIFSRHSFYSELIGALSVQEMTVQL
jgi:hypothetical protein